MPDQQPSRLQLNPQQKIQDELTARGNKNSCDWTCWYYENASRVTKDQNKMAIQLKYSFNNQLRHKSFLTSFTKPADERHQVHSQW